MTDFRFDPKGAVAHLSKADSALAEVIGAVGPFGMQLKASRSLFGALAEAIVYQQLSNKAAATIYGRIEALYPRAKSGFTPLHIRRNDRRPVDDYSLRKAYATAFHKRKLPSPEALAKAGEKWRPYRTVASWYLWQTLNK